MAVDLSTQAGPRGRTPALRSPIVIDGVAQVAAHGAPGLDADGWIKESVGWPDPEAQ